MENISPYSHNEMNCPPGSEMWNKLLFDGVRPKFTENFVFPELQDVTQKCWQKNPCDRPTIEEVLKIVKEMLSNQKIAENIETIEAFAFWKNYFGNVNEVAWNDFFKVFCRFVDLKKTNKLSNAKFDRKKAVLQALFCMFIIFVYYIFFSNFFVTIQVILMMIMIKLLL